MSRSVEEIYEDALKLSEDEREILEVLLRCSLPLPDKDYAEIERKNIERERRQNDGKNS